MCDGLFFTWLGVDVYLTAASVDAFFNFMAASYAVGSFVATLDTSGGTSAAPTSASSSARSTLASAGCTIITN